MEYVHRREGEQRQQRSGKTKGGEGEVVPIPRRASD